jgi:hypothetical protein
LSSNENEIYWKSLSKNPNAIDLLNKRIQFENTLTKEELYWLDLENNIDWYSLSLNPNAIELLTNNQDKIDWESLSANPNAIYLLKIIKMKLIGIIYLQTLQYLKMNLCLFLYKK